MKTKEEWLEMFDRLMQFQYYKTHDDFPNWSFTSMWSEGLSPQDAIMRIVIEEELNE